MHIKNKRGQSTVEYILLMTAVVAVIIAFVAGNKSAFQNTLNGSLNTVTGDIGDMGSRLQSSHVAAAGGGSGTPSGYSVNPTGNPSTNGS